MPHVGTRTEKKRAPYLVWGESVYVHKRVLSDRVENIEEGKTNEQNEPGSSQR